MKLDSSMVGQAHGSESSSFRSLPKPPALSKGFPQGLLMPKEEGAQSEPHPQILGEQPHLKKKKVWKTHILKDPGHWYGRFFSSDDIPLWCVFICLGSSLPVQLLPESCQRSHNFLIAFHQWAVVLTKQKMRKCSCRAGRCNLRLRRQPLVAPSLMWPQRKPGTGTRSRWDVTLPSETAEFLSTYLDIQSWDQASAVLWGQPRQKNKPRRFYVSHSLLKRGPNSNTLRSQAISYSRWSRAMTFPHFQSSQQTQLIKSCIIAAVKHK